MYDSNFYVENDLDVSIPHWRKEQPDLIFSRFKPTRMNEIHFKDEIMEKLKNGTQDTELVFEIVFWKPIISTAI